MRTLAAADLQPRDRHDLMLSTILPRPIAWVMSMNDDGTTNLAPFSYFNGMSATPPMVSISVGKRRSGEWKDTRRNIEATREYVIHVVDEPHAHHMVETGADHPPGTSEVELLGLKTTKSSVVAVPRLAEAPVAMECRLVDVYEAPGASAALIIGEILAWHVRDGLLPSEGERPFLADVHRLRPVARLGGTEYCPVREVFTMRPPQ